MLVKVCEYCILHNYDNLFISDELQFEFKKNTTLHGIPLRELTMLPQTPSRLGRVKPLPIPHRLALDLRSSGRGFDSRSGRYQAI